MCTSIYCSVIFQFFKYTYQTVLGSTLPFDGEFFFFSVIFSLGERKGMSDLPLAAPVTGYCKRFFFPFPPAVTVIAVRVCEFLRSETRLVL